MKARGPIRVGMLWILLVLLSLSASARAQGRPQTPRLEILPLPGPTRSIAAITADEEHLVAASYGQILVWKRQTLAFVGSALLPVSAYVPGLEIDGGPCAQRHRGQSA